MRQHKRHLPRKPHAQVQKRFRRRGRGPRRRQSARQSRGIRRSARYDARRNARGRRHRPDTQHHHAAEPLFHQQAGAARGQARLRREAARADLRRGQGADRARREQGALRRLRAGYLPRRRHTDLLRADKERRDRQARRRLGFYDVPRARGVAPLPRLLLRLRRRPAV